jgi:hypothetical protein
MKNYKVNVTVKLTIAADNDDALTYLLREMDYGFKHCDSQSEIVDSEITDAEVVAEY